MNKFEEADILSKLNSKIKSESFNSLRDYKPIDDDLPPSEYAQHGYVKGQQELLEWLLEKDILTVYNFEKLLW